MWRSASRLACISFPAGVGGQVVAYRFEFAKSYPVKVIHHASTEVVILYRQAQDVQVVLV